MARVPPREKEVSALRQGLPPSRASLPKSAVSKPDLGGIAQLSTRPTQKIPIRATRGDANASRLVMILRLVPGFFAAGNSVGPGWVRQLPLPPRPFRDPSSLLPVYQVRPKCRITSKPWVQDQRWLYCHPIQGPGHFQHHVTNENFSINGGRFRGSKPADNRRNRSIRAAKTPRLPSPLR